MHIQLKPVLFAFSFACIGFVNAQGFRSGSNGSMGELVVTNDITLETPADGKFHFSRVEVLSGGILRFTRNPANSPIQLLSVGDIIIEGEGEINVSGGNGSLLSNGEGGPGGFNGGPGAQVGKEPGDGFGPGGGGAATGPGGSNDEAGNAGYATPGGSTTGTGIHSGPPYGNRSLVNLVGGSGGGGGLWFSGFPGGGGGGGGGAILVSSDSRIIINGPKASGRASGKVVARGGTSIVPTPQITGGSGSGGAIRVVAPYVAISSVDSLDTKGWSGINGMGRSRIDRLSGPPLPPIAFVKDFTFRTEGTHLVTAPVNLPSIQVVEVAGNEIPEGTREPVLINLPPNADTNQIVRLVARDFRSWTLVQVVLTPEFGPTRVFPVSLNLAETNRVYTNVMVTFPLGVPTTVHAWSR